MSKNKEPEDIVVDLLTHIGEDPRRPGLQDTPRRVAKMWGELYKGYFEMYKPKVTVFENHNDGLSYDQLITDSGYFYSQCEHHMAPFFGRYFFGYIPGSKVLGLSKVARVVDYHSARLQVQERLVKEIVDQLEEALGDPQAIGLILEGRHLCKEMRGVRKVNGTMTTSDLRGKFRTEAPTRAEFISFYKS